MEITYYVHGSTLDNESMIASGWDQVSLSPRGVEKTKKAAPYVDTRLFDAVFASDLIRAIETAEILFADRKTEIKTDPRLRECDYGTLTKKPSAEIAYGEHIDRPFPRGESLREVEARMREFLREAKRHNYQRIAIVSHRAPQLALEVIVSKTTWEHAIMNDWRISGRWQPGWKYIDD